ncbi:hypothetical protein O181_009896 [Austropuccinia psidii MF-1]|uniref:Uncharacterized protein n=1 Tax=Austropuccinia psidii MF-1 TaxID=1389203 RepID=A0A9Q3BSQ4_9BASI|nr:hypothetical protein [Austropuccinia psidii MF-1]
MIIPVPSSINLSTPLQGHHPMVTSLLNCSKVIIRPMKHGNGRRTFDLGPIVTISCQPWDSNAKNKTNQIPCDKTHWFLVILASKLRGNRLQAPVAPNEPSQHNEPPIPGPSLSSEPYEDVLTCEPEPEVARRNPQRNHLVSPHFMFFTLTRFSSPLLRPYPACPTPPCSIIIIDNMLFGSPSPQSHNEAWKEFKDLRTNLMIPQAIVYKSIN